MVARTAVSVLVLATHALGAALQSLPVSSRPLKLVGSAGPAAGQLIPQVAALRLRGGFGLNNIKSNISDLNDRIFKSTTDKEEEAASASSAASGAMAAGAKASATMGVPLSTKGAKAPASAGRPAVAAPVAATKPAAVSTAEDATSTGEAPPLATASDQGAVVKDPAEDRVTAALESLEGAEKDVYGNFQRLSIVMVSSELARFAKSGGLADVADKLSAALAKRGHRVMSVCPMYGDGYHDVAPSGCKRDFGVFGGNHQVEYWHKWEAEGLDRFGNESGVDRVFVAHQCFRRPGMYGENGKDYQDNLMRFALFSWASCEAPLCMPTISPFGDDVVFIANDWQTGLVPLIMTSHYKRHGCFTNARSLFVVHNMGYHGVYPNPPTWQQPKFSFQDMGLRDNSYYDKFQWTFPIDERPSKGRDPRDDGAAIKLLRGGIEMADRVVTVAPSYKDEIQSLEGGFGMHDSARGRQYHLDGVLNGLDVEEWNPEQDPHIAPNFFSIDNPGNKSLCKKSLQFQLGLHERPDTPMIAFIGRLAPQKGVDIIEQILPWLLNADQAEVTGDVQLVMMGSGDSQYAEFLKNAEAGNKGRVVGYVGFSPEMEHKIIAAADILIMPSRYEPCGLPQMYAQRYGTVPVVHATGGLKDSVVQYDPFADVVEVQATEEGGNTTLVETEGRGTGWQFDRADAGGLMFGVWNALNTYKNHKVSWAKMMKRCMRTDFSWELSAKKYEQIMYWAKGDAALVNPWPF